VYHFLLVIHITVSFLLVLVVLLQSGKGAGLNLFGGGGETLFSAPSGSSFLRRFTSGLAITFGITSLLLTLLSTRAEMGTVTSRIPPPPPATGTQPPTAPQSGSQEPIRPVRPGEAAVPQAPIRK